MTWNHRTVVIALALVAGAGCAQGADDDDAMLAEDTELETQPAPEPDAGPSDPEIAHIAVTANTIDIETARLAESRTSTPEVLGFAETMISDHTAVNEQASELAERLGVTPQDNDVSRSLQAGSDAARAELAALNGSEFDRAYADREVEFHQAVLDALDDTLIPSADNAELRELLEEVRPAIAAHLERARALRSSLGSEG